MKKNDKEKGRYKNVGNVDSFKVDRRFERF